MRMTPEPHWFEGPLTFTVEDHDLRSAVRTDAPVLISGWSTSGREALARVIRSHGSRSHQPFTMVDCGAHRHRRLPICTPRECPRERLAQPVLLVEKPWRDEDTLYVCARSRIAP